MNDDQLRERAGELLTALGYSTTDGHARAQSIGTVVTAFQALLSSLHPQAGAAPEKPLACGACSRGNHADCSGWCFCPNGPCDRPKPTGEAPASDVPTKDGEE